MNSCIVITNEAPFSGMVNLAKSLGDVDAIVVGTQALANSVASSGVRAVYFSETTFPEAQASLVASQVKTLSPKLVLTSNAAGARALAGAISGVLDSVVISGVTAVSIDADSIVVEQEALSGRVLETLSSQTSVVGFYAGEDAELANTSAVVITPLTGSAYAMEMRVSSSGSGSSGLADAARVVSIGRGVKNKDDISLITTFASTIDAEMGCSMPIADDLGWLPKERYIGRSGQSTSPRVYFAVGISGAPQHLEGARRAKVIVAINNDPEARIFRSADYGIVGDLYEIVPALTQVLK